MSKVTVTKSIFNRFIEVRDSGETNMCDARMVSMLACITKEQAMDIVINFSEYNKKYGKKGK